MAMSLPKIRAMGSNIKIPKITMPKLKMVSKPSIGYTKPTMSGILKTKIKLK